MAYKKNGNTAVFTVNKVNYTIEYVDKDLIEIYETDNPLKTGFVFSGGKKSLIPFINCITDITEDMGDIYED